MKTNLPNKTYLILALLAYGAGSTFFGFTIKDAGGALCMFVLVRCAFHPLMSYEAKREAKYQLGGRSTAESAVWSAEWHHH